MKTARPEPNESFAERIERLERELALALHWDRPSILVVVYASELVRADVEAELEAWVREQGQAATRVQVTGPDDPSADVPLLLREWPNRAQTVFFVSGLRWGAPTAWNALNIRREYLVEDRIRAVFWLTEGEAAELPLRAPDFWAFRHRVVEFLELPEVSRAARVASDLAWAGFEERLSPGERRARIAFRKQLLSELPESLETAAARAELHYTLGGLHYFGREHVKALEYFQAALELAERVDDVRLQAMVLNGLGNVYRALGRHEEAIAAYQRAIELDATYAYPYHGLGNVYRDLRRHKEAIAACQKAIDLDPNNPYLHNLLGLVYRSLRRHEEAIAAYLRAIELDPTFAHPHNNLGELYHTLGRPEEAIAAYRKAIELDPTFAHPYNGLGNIYHDLGRYDEAVAAYQQAIELDPQNAGFHNNLGAVYPDLGRYDEAIAAFQQAIELRPNYASAYNGLGCIYAELDRHEKAIAAFQRAIELDPAYAHPNISLAGIYCRLGDEPKSRHHLAEARRLIEPHDHTGQTCLESIAGNVEAALEHLEKALKTRPGLRAWARRDPDLAFIRDDPRFRVLVGEMTAEEITSDGEIHDD